MVVLQHEDSAQDVLHRIPHYTQRSRGLPPRTSSYSFIHLSLLTCHACDAPTQGRLDGSLHTGRDSPRTSKAISLYHDIRGIQLAVGILQWMTVADDLSVTKIRGQPGIRPPTLALGFLPTPALRWIGHTAADVAGAKETAHTPPNGH